MHSEIAYRSAGSSGVYEKVRDDGSKLIETLRNAVVRGEGLPWTSLVLLGDAWPTRTRQVMTAVHNLTCHHPSFGSTIERVPLASREWWPFLDAIVMPGVAYKKHDLFESEAAAVRRDADDQRWPCWFSFPSDPTDPLRSLVIARAYIVHRVRLLQAKPDEIADDADAWSLTDTAALVGPWQPLRTHPETGLVYLARDLDQPRVLWHAGYDRRRDRYVPVARKARAQPTCAVDAAFVLAH